MVTGFLERSRILPEWDFYKYMDLGVSSALDQLVGIKCPTALSVDNNNNYLFDPRIPEGRVKKNRKKLIEFSIKCLLNPF